MPTQIDGGRQIKSATITNTQIASGANIALSKLEEPVIQADGGQAFTADQSMGSHKLTNLQDGSSASDAVTKQQLDAVAAAISGGGAHTGVRVASTGNVSISSAPAAIDGVTLAASDRVFLKNQTAPAENGIYVFNGTGSAMTRATDADTWDELVMTPMVPVEEGTANSDTLWLITADRGGVLETTAVAAVQLPGPSDILAGAGMTRTGQTFDIVAADTSVTVGADNVAVNLNTSGGLETSTGVRVKLNGSTLDRSSSGMKVADAGITGTQLAASVAGDGLSGGAGSALSVNVDGSTIETNSDALRVKDGGITSAKLGTGARRVVRETPSGSVNGSNTSFTLANAPASGMEEVYLNGILQEPGAGNDYTISTNTITYLSAPLTGDRLRVSYMY